MTYSLNFDADNVGKIIDLRSDGCFQFRFNNQIDIQLNVPGAHNVSNALVAGTVGNQFGISYNDMKHAIESFQLSANRIQIFRSKEITVLNDTYNSNSGSLIVAFEVIESLLKKQIGRAIIVLGDMLELGKMSTSEHKMIGEEVASRKFDFLLVYGDESLITAEAAQALGMTNVQHFTNKEKLAGKLDDILQPNDIVLVKGSRGMAMEEVLEKTDKLQK